MGQEGPGCPTLTHWGPLGEAWFQSPRCAQSMWLGSQDGHSSTLGL